MQQQLEMAETIISKHADSMTPLYGVDYGTAKLVRDGRSFRIFVKEIEATKSGKAKLVDMTVFVSVDGKPFARVDGVTYLPNFVIDNKDVYWILENKISGKLQDDPTYITIKAEYIPAKYTARMYHHSYGNKRTPEANHLHFLKSFYEDKNRVEAKMRLEVAMEYWV